MATRTKKQSSSETASDSGAPKHLLDSFTEQLAAALQYINEPTTLGNESPLASAYLLAAHLRGQQQGDSALHRGRVLQHLLLEAMVDLADPNDPRRRHGEHLRAQLAQASGLGRDLYRQQLLDHLREGNRMQRLLYWSFLHEPRFATIEPMLDSDNLDMSRATYYRQLPKAIQQLAAAVVQRLRPALRLEAAPTTTQLVERDDLLQACRHALTLRHTIALVGPGGIGKTALGAAIASAADAPPAFWYTIRPGLNDHPRTLLFMLAAFLYEQGAPSLWLHLIAEQERPTSADRTALLRADIAALPVPPLLCIDEIDLLQPAEVEAHSEVLALLEGLRGSAPMVVMGQRAAFDADLVPTLEGLSPAAIQTLLARVGPPQGDDLARVIYEQTGGNPRLIHLLLALASPDRPLATTLHELGSKPSLDALLVRIQRRLADDERTLLLQLSVFRRATPQDAWQSSTLQGLLDRRLVQADGRGGVAVLPALRAPLYATLPADVRRALHVHGASVRATRGEYTAAAFHYIRAGHAHLAINLWQRHSQEEINQGQGQIALALFSEVAATQLPNTRDQEQLALVRATLRKLSGDYWGAQAELAGRAWVTPALKLLAHRLEGDITELTNQFDQAIAAYEAGVATAQASLQTDVVQLRKGLSRVALRQQDMQRARREAQIARYEVENIQGNIEELQGQYGAARQHYQAALALAEELGHTQGEAKTRNNLAAILARLEAFDHAHEQWERACALLQQMGHIAGLASARVNQAFGYNLAGRHQAAVAPAHEALALFERLGEPAGRAAAAQNLAEAYLALNELVLAEQYAQRVVDERDALALPDGLRVLGEIRLAQGDNQAAARLITQSLDAARENDDPFLEAYALRSLGRVQHASSQRMQAVSSFERASTIFADLGLPHEVEATQRLAVTTCGSRAVAPSR